MKGLIPYFTTVFYSCFYLKLVFVKTKNPPEKEGFVLEAGLEPARPKEHRILSPACLPIPPLEHMIGIERKTGFEPATLTLAR